MQGFEWEHTCVCLLTKCKTNTFKEVTCDRFISLSHVTKNMGMIGHCMTDNCVYIYNCVITRKYYLTHK